MKILFKNVTVIDSQSEFNNQNVNIFIENGIIKKIGKAVLEADKVIDLKGEYVSPGWFDMRCSLCDPGFEHKESLQSGLEAATAGGFTGLACSPDTQPIIQSKDTIHYIKSSVVNAIVDVYPIASLTHNFKGEELSEILELQKAGAIAFMDGNEPIWHSGVLVRALQYLQPFNGLLIQHPEEKKLSQYGQMNEGITSTYLGLKGIPYIAEELIVSRDLELLQYAGGKIHFAGISTKGSVELIRNAKKAGLSVTCDVTVPNLVFDDTVLTSFDSNYKVNPPLRTSEDIKALWKGIEENTIDCIVTDHKPQDEESKNLEFDLAEFGMINLETAFSALLHCKPNKLPLSRLLEKFSSTPRQVLGLSQNSITENKEANLTFFSENLEWTYTLENKKSKSKNSPFFGKSMKGKVLGTINKGILNF